MPQIIKFGFPERQFSVFRFGAVIEGPDEPFSGRYVMFERNEQRLTVNKKIDFDTETVDCYAVLGEDENGLAKVADIARKPEPDAERATARAGAVAGKKINQAKLAAALETVYLYAFA